MDLLQSVFRKILWFTDRWLTERLAYNEDRSIRLISGDLTVLGKEQVVGNTRGKDQRG